MHQRTVSRHPIRAELYRLKDIKPRDEDLPQRYEHEESGDMIHIALKNLQNFDEERIWKQENGNRHKSANKIAGTQCMHVSVDDLSRYAIVSLLGG